MWGFGKGNGNSEMIRRQIKGRGIKNREVLDAMSKVDRKDFVPDDQVAIAYEDRPVPLMPGATVSQPYIVALMTELLEVVPHHRAMEIGTGSGYQAAVLSHLAREVIGVEMQPELVAYARERLQKSGCRNVTVVQGDGWQGHAAGAPYDRIVVTAAPESVPTALLDQLAVNGRMVIPVGSRHMQELEVIDKLPGDELRHAKYSMVQFVPLVSSGEESE